MGCELLKRSLRFKAKLYIFHDPELFGVGLLLAILGKKIICNFAAKTCPCKSCRKSGCPDLADGCWRQQFGWRSGWVRDF